MKNKVFQSEQDLFARNAQGISKIFHEQLLLLKTLGTKPQVKFMKITSYDLYYTVNKTRDERGIFDNQYENGFINFKEFITPINYIGIKIDNVILR